MAKHRTKKSNDWYRAAILGVRDAKGELSPGLRFVAKGFDAASGYDLHALQRGEWTAGQKRKVSRYFHELQQLTAQEKIIVKTRSPKRLQQAQAIGGHDPKYKFKVAFVPGSKDARIEWTDEGIVVRERGYSKVEAVFDPVRLARDSAAEIARVTSTPRMRKANRFRIQAGTNLIGNLYDKGTLSAEVRRLMHQYDGKRQLPRSSGNRGDRPSAHNWRKWLHGVTGYILPKAGGKVTSKKAFDELERNRDLRQRKYNKRKAETRKGRK